MFRLYSKGCEYAIRALTHVVPSNGVERFQAKTICQKAGIPEAYTRKVFQSLVAGRFLEAARGPGGGYQLKEPPQCITLLEIIQAVDGQTAFDGCVMGLSECGERNPCPLHDIWSATKHDLLAQLDQTTLKNLIEAQNGRGSGE